MAIKNGTTLIPDLDYDNKHEQREKHLRRYTALVLALLILCLVACVGLLLFRPFAAADDREPTTPMVLDPAATQPQAPVASQPGGQDGSAQQNILIPGYPELRLRHGQSTLMVSLLNPEQNPCYFSYELLDAKTREPFYASALIPPGQAINNPPITRDFAPGEHSIVVRVKTLSLDGKVPMNGAEVHSKLLVA